MSVRRKARRGGGFQPSRSAKRHGKSKKAFDNRLAHAPYAPCVECNGQGKPMLGEVLFPGEPSEARRIYYVCQCGAYVGAIKHGHPAGYPAGPATRFARARAHEAADAIWRNGHMASRQAVYAWLAGKMGMDPLKCSISRMGRLEAYRVTRLCEEYLDEARRTAQAQEAADKQKAVQAERKADEAFRKAPPAFLGEKAS